MRSSFQDGRIRLPAFVRPDLRARLRVLALQTGKPFQEYLEQLLTAAADLEEKSRKAKA